MQHNSGSSELCLQEERVIRHLLIDTGISKRGLRKGLHEIGIPKNLEVF